MKWRYYINMRLYFLGLSVTLILFSFEGLILAGDKSYQNYVKDKSKTNDPFIIKLFRPPSVDVNAEEHNPKPPPPMRPKKEDLIIILYPKDRIQFPIIVYIEPKKGWNPPHGGKFDQLKRKFLKPHDTPHGFKVVLWEDLIYCWGYTRLYRQTPNASFYIRFTVKVVDANNNQNQVHIAVKCKIP